MFDMPIPVRAVARMLVLAVIGMLLAPWFVLDLARLVLRRVESATSFAASFRAVVRDDVRCPRGHRSELRGIFECRSCGSLFAGWAFQACPTCGMSCGHIACERCGLTIRNPLV